MLKRVLVLFVLVLGLWGCGDRLEASLPNELTPEAAQPIVTQALTEVAVPSLIAELRRDLDQYQPQVKILSPRPNETINSTTASIKLQVSDLPIYKDAELGMGPHIHLFVDDQPYQAVYDTSQSIILENLSAGSHLIRAFASRPWHESFKNEGAYAESTFNIFTESNTNIPDFQQPLLTYSRPQGTYGAEPIMLDFYLTNAPLHFVAKENEADNINDWRIRVTVNGESFVIDDWQPIYLEGFKKGENWIKLEFIDDQGELLENVYNNPVRVINYDPKVNDTLAKLVQNKLPLRTAKRLVTTKELPPELETEIIEETLPEVTPEPEVPVVEDSIPVEEEILIEEPEETPATVDSPEVPLTQTKEDIQATPQVTTDVPETDSPEEATEAITEAETTSENTEELKETDDEITVDAEEILDSPEIDESEATTESESISELDEDEDIKE